MFPYEQFDFDDVLFKHHSDVNYNSEWEDNYDDDWNYMNGDNREKHIYDVYSHYEEDNEDL